MRHSAPARTVQSSPCHKDTEVSDAPCAPLQLLLEADTLLKHSYLGSNLISLSINVSNPPLSWVVIL